MPRDDDLIRASEISQYVYCTRAWWFSRVKGYQPENAAALQQGTARHRRHGRRVERFHLQRRLALFLLLLAAVALVAWLRLGLGGG